MTYSCLKPSPLPPPHTQLSAKETILSGYVQKDISSPPHSRPVVSPKEGRQPVFLIPLGLCYKGCSAGKCSQNIRTLSTQLPLREETLPQVQQAKSTRTLINLFLDAHKVKFPCQERQTKKTRSYHPN